MGEGSERPAIRAGLSQAVLDLVERSAAASEVLRRSGPSVVEEIRGVLPVAWLPMQLHMDLSNAIWDVAGPEFVRRTFRAAMNETYRRPLLKNFLSLTTGLFGSTPVALFRRADGIYRLVTRDLGAVTTTLTGPSNVLELHLNDFPSDQFDFDRFVEGLGGAVESVLDFCSVSGAVRLLDHHAASGDASLELTWR